ncbi:hypothetical protein ES708_14267 [subsurface metagenome]
MNFLRYPIRSLQCDLTHAEHTVYRHLLLRFFRYCRGDYDSFFYITNRDLSVISGCSVDTIWKAKKHLKDSGLIDYFIGDKNRTYYQIIEGNGNDPLK